MQKLNLTFSKDELSGWTTESPLKMIKIAFHFTSKNLLVLEIL